MFTLALASLLIAQGAKPAYIPALTRVLVLPCVDASGDKQANMSMEEIDEADATIGKRFSERGFVVVSGADAMAAETSVGVDLTVKANRTDENLYKVGAAAKARLVVFTMVEKTGTKMRQRLMDSHMEGYVALRTWLLDVPDRHAYLSDARKDADSTKVDAKEKSRQVRAVRVALDEQLHEFLKPYPEPKK